MRTTGVQRMPAAALSFCSGRDVVPARVTIGIPMEPKVTGAVFASRQRAAAVNGANPKPMSMVEAMATGAPNPAAPSRNAPNAKAMSNAWRRGSGVSRPMDVLMRSNWPVSTETLNKTSAQKMIQVMGKRPKAAPSAAALSAGTSGIR